MQRHRRRRECWKAYQVPEFSRDHKVIIFDYRGTGRSSKTVMKYTTTMFAADAAAILDELGAEGAIVCGHSNGGRVAQALALDYPRKVSKLILASSGAPFSETKGIPLKLCHGMIEKGFEKYVREHTIETGWTPEFVAAHRDVVDKFLAVRMAGIAPLACYLRHVIARQEHDTSARLKDIQIPTLVMIGEDEHAATGDLSHRASADILRRDISHAKFVVLPGQRHHYWVSDPVAVHKAIRETCMMNAKPPPAVKLEVQWFEKPKYGGGKFMSEAFIPTQYDIFAGLDVDKKSIAVTFSGQQGFICSLRMPYNAEYLLNYVRKHFAHQKVVFAYEAGPTGWGLYDGLVAQAHPCLVVAPSMVPRAPGQRVKTNRLDSRGLSENLRGGQLKSIHVPSQCYRELRHLTQLRDTFVSEVVAMKLRIKSLLLLEGIAFPPAPAGSQWSLLVKDKLRKLPCSKTVRFKLDQLLQSLEFNEKQALKTTQRIRRFCQSEPELAQSIKNLMTVPGIGWIVASQLLARIGDPSQIKNVRQLGGFLGLVSTENSTGDRTDRGSITHSGDGRLRGKLIQASWSAIRKDSELREFFRSVCRTHDQKRAKRVAIVAVARKLTTRITAVLKQQRPYTVRETVHSAPLTQEETTPQGTTRR